MATVVDCIAAMTEWVRSEAVSGARLKVPSSTAQDSRYEYQLSEPAVHAMYVPPATLTTDQIGRSCPSVTVQLLSVTDVPARASRALKFRLVLCTWDPGFHDGDVAGGADGGFEPNGDGWLDTWNLMDRILESLKAADTIGGLLRVKTEEAVECGPYKEDGALVDFYPYYLSQVEFACETGQPAAPVNYVGDFL